MCSKRKGLNFKAFNMIINKDDAEEMTRHISCEKKRRFKCEKDYSWNPSTYICENNKYLKSPADTAVTECDEIVVAINNLSRKKTITIATKKNYYE